MWEPRTFVMTIQGPQDNQPPNPLPDSPEARNPAEVRTSEVGSTPAVNEVSSTSKNPLSVARPPVVGTSATEFISPSEESSLPENHRNVAMLVAYNGSAFQGWQLQPNAPTVQGVLEDAFRVLFRRRCTLYGSGRTDTGVHAFNQVANVRLPLHADLRKVRTSLNGLAAPHISVKAMVDVPDSFHARHMALGKHYRYQIFNRAYPPVFGPQQTLWVKKPLDVGAMTLAARHLHGDHDFSAFRSSDCGALSPVRRLTRVEVTEVSDPDCTLRVDLEGNGFLQHMVRIIVGTLISVGSGKLIPDDVADILVGRERIRAPATAPGRGLHLMKVRYDLEAYPALKIFDEV